MSDRRLLSYKTVWPSGLRRWLQAPVRKGVGSNPTAVMLHFYTFGEAQRGPPSAPLSFERLSVDPPEAHAF